MAALIGVGSLMLVRPRRGIVRNALAATTGVLMLRRAVSGYSRTYHAAG